MAAVPAVVGPTPKEDTAASAAPPSVDDLVAEITQHTAGLKPLLRPCTPMSLAWEDVTVEVPDRSAPGPAADGSPRTRSILNKVSGNVVPGELVAILGSSGAGKTTLLNVLSRRNRKNRGLINANGRPLGRNFNQFAAFVQQEDLFLGTLTVREHLRYVAMLRMDPALLPSEKDQHVDRLINALQLTNVANSVIGGVRDGLTRGISGGERKRLAFASEIITDPSLLFADEPTSGLDSYMAQNVVAMMQMLARCGRTVLATVHQPSSEIYAMFDRILLLAEGRTVYFGPREQAVAYFRQLGARYTCPDHFNPADFWIIRLADARSKPGEVERLARHWEASEACAAVLARVPWPVPAVHGFDHHHHHHHHAVALSSAQPAASAPPAASVHADPDSAGDTSDATPMAKSSPGATVVDVHLSGAGVGAGAVAAAGGANPEPDAAMASPVTDASPATAASPSPYTSPEALALPSRAVASEPDANRWLAMGDLPPPEDGCCVGSSHRTTWCEQLRILTSRAIVSNYRSPILTRVRFFQTVVLSLICGLIYLRLENGQVNVQDKNGAMFFVIINQSMTAILGVLQTFPQERFLFLREYEAGSYRVDTYYIAKMISDIPFQLFFPSLFSCIVYWMVGFNDEAWRFGAFLGIILLVSNVAMSLGFFVSCFVPTVEVALGVGPVVLIPFLVFAGFLVNTDSIPKYFIWLEYTSWFKFGFSALANIVWSDVVLDCPPAPLPCRFPTGESVIEYLSLRQDDMGRDIGALVALLVGWRVLAFFALLWGARRRQNE